MNLAQSARPARTEAPQWQTDTGQLMIAECRDCGEPHYYPRVLCPFCGGENLAWKACSGQGRIYAVSVFRRANPPYALAFVELDEGPRMMTNIMDCDLDSIAIHDPVSVVFIEQNGIPTPMFTPSKTGAVGEAG